MSYDNWKCTPPEEELELEVCGHTIGTCKCDEVPVDEEPVVIRVPEGDEPGLRAYSLWHAARYEISHEVNTVTWETTKPTNRAAWAVVESRLEQAAYERGKAEREPRRSLFSGLPIDPSEATIANAPTLRDSVERERVREMQAAIARAGALLEANGCDCECDHHPEEHDDECVRCLACLIERTLGPVGWQRERLVRP